ncbi:hypothetical protein BHM03_00059934 [Ensete ventricosum]|nr:hypothetical protein BHM03_00059934 [Ensete ventricosum]
MLRAVAEAEGPLGLLRGAGRERASGVEGREREGGWGDSVGEKQRAGEGGCTTGREVPAREVKERTARRGVQGLAPPRREEGLGEGEGGRKEREERHLRLREGKHHRRAARLTHQRRRPASTRAPGRRYPAASHTHEDED